MNRIASSCAKTAPRLALAALALGLILLAPGGARAAAPAGYKVQPIVKLGDTVAGVKLLYYGQFWLGGVSDSGQILFAVWDGVTHRLIQYEQGKFTPIAIPNGDGPNGKWPNYLYVYGPWTQSMNSSGQVVFAAADDSGPSLDAQGTFLWDPKTLSSTPVALKQMPAGSGLTFTNPGGFNPAINNHGEIALLAGVSGPGGLSGYGLFFRKPDGSLQTILLPGQDLPGGGKATTDDWLDPAINDAGRVAFVTRRGSDPEDSAYVWENGSITPVLAVGTDLPGIGKVHRVSGVALNNTDQSMLVTATMEGADMDHHGLYRVAGGTISAIAVPGQVLPDGGTFRTMKSYAGTDGPETVSWAISAANAAGQHAFVAQLDGGATAAYIVDAGGKLTPLLKSGAVTDLGTITSLGSGNPGSDEWSDVSLNSQGQVILVASIDQGPLTLLLLTPTKP